MSTVSLLALVAGSWGVIMSIAPLLQIRTMVRARSSAGVSLGYLRVLLVGFVLWFSYGVALGDLALIVCNALSAAVGVTTIAVALRYRPRAGVAEPLPAEAVESRTAAGTVARWKGDPPSRSPRATRRGRASGPRR